MNLSENVKKAYETYIEGDKKKAFDLLIPGSEHHYYLTILDALKSEKHKVTKKTEDLIKEYLNKFGQYNEDVKRIDLRKHLLKFDGAKDKEKEEVIEYLQKNFIFGNFTHTKPADLK